MLLGGLWHGAKWNFVVWGAYHGALLAFERWRGKTSLYSQLAALSCAWASRSCSMLFSWVLFRADNLTLAGRYFGAMFGLVAAESGIDPAGSRALHAAEPAGDGGFGRTGLPAGAGPRVGPTTSDLGARRAADPVVRLSPWQPCTPRPSIRSSISSSRTPVKSPHRPEMVLVLSFLAILAAPAIVQTVIEWRRDGSVQALIGVSPASHCGQPARLRTGTRGRQLGGADSCGRGSSTPSSRGCKTAATRRSSDATAGCSTNRASAT